MTILVFLICMGCAAVGLDPKSMAQANVPAPTLAETQQWMNSFLASHGCATFTDREGSYRTICTVVRSTNGCTVVTGNVTMAFFPDGSVDTRIPSQKPTSTIDFKQVAFNSAKINALPASNSGSWSGNYITIENMDGVVIGLRLYMDSQESGVRLVKALNAETQLCGGKPSPF
jgi:hypothetical protein